MSEERTPWDLKLHESMFVEETYNGEAIEKFSEEIFCMRVPGGWIYNYVVEGKTIMTVFVPWSPIMEG